MTHRARRTSARIASVLLASLTPAVAAAQTRDVPPSPEAWIATDSMRFVSYPGRPSVYINRGVALVRGTSMENGVLDLDVAASDTTTFLGVAFRAATPRFSNILYLRPGPVVRRKLSSTDRRSTAWDSLGRLRLPGRRH
jgi:hypothetical protein